MRKDAAKLACNLEKLGINIPDRIITVRSFKHDLEFNYKNKEVVIEITNQDLSEIYQSNFKHQRVGGNIRAHIFDIYRDCVTDKILNSNKKIGFVVLNNCWENVKHINEIINKCRLVKYYVLFANFLNENWAKYTAKEIINILKNESRNSKRNFKW